MKEYIKKRVWEITNPVAYQYGYETKESIYWRLSELALLAEKQLGDWELAEEIRKTRDKQ